MSHSKDNWFKCTHIIIVLIFGLETLRIWEPSELRTFGLEDLRKWEPSELWAVPRSDYTGCGIQYPRHRLRSHVFFCELHGGEGRCYLINKMAPSVHDIHHLRIIMYIYIRNMILLLNERMQMRANDEQNLRRRVNTLLRAEIIRQQRFHNVLKSNRRRYHVHRRRHIIAFILSMSSLPHMATVERNIWKKPRFANIYNDITTWTWSVKRWSNENAILWKPMRRCNKILHLFVTPYIQKS